MEPEDGTLESQFEEQAFAGASRDSSVAAPLGCAGPVPSAESPNTSVMSATPLTVISKRGDLILYFGEDATPTPARKWQVASTELIRNSPYFRALLDPNKFREGRHLVKQKNEHDTRCQGAMRDDSGDSGTNQAAIRVDVGRLPTISLPSDSFPRHVGIDAMDLFLRILSLDSANVEDTERLNETVRHLSTSAAASLIEAADIFNSPGPVRNILQKVEYSYGRSKTTFNRFSSVFLKMNEDRMRQIIFIAVFLNDPGVVQTLTHALIILGSRYWVNGAGVQSAEGSRWRFLPGGLEGTVSPCRDFVEGNLSRNGLVANS